MTLQIHERRKLGIERIGCSDTDVCYFPVAIITDDVWLELCITQGINEVAAYDRHIVLAHELLGIFGIIVELMIAHRNCIVLSLFDDFHDSFALRYCSDGSALNKIASRDKCHIGSIG